MTGYVGGPFSAGPFSEIKTLDSFAAFAEVATGDSGFWGGLTNLAAAGTNVYSAIRSSDAASRNASGSAALAAELAKLKGGPAGPATPMNWTPIIIGGVALLAIVAFVAMKK